MFTIHDKFLKGASGFFTAIGAAVAFCAGIATDVNAQVPPANDNLAQAQGIIGSTGSATGTNLYATMESAEPAPYGAGASIWYLWTAPYTTTISFNTRGSTDPNTGEPLDTVLAVYSLKSGTNVAYTNLNQVVANDDDPSGGITSRVDFPVTVGHVYLIQALSSTNDPTGANTYSQGIVVLNWSPSLVAGTFGFSASAYAAGELDDIIPIDYGGNSVGPSLANKSGTNNIRITVVRQGGAVGRCEVTLLVTNQSYTNLYETNYTGTNIYVTNYDLAGNVLSFTNSFFTNVASENLLAEYINIAGVPQLEYIPDFGVFTVTETNTSLLTGFPTTNFFVSQAGLGLTNYFTNWSCINAVITPPPVTNGSVVTATVTQIFCITTISNSFTVSASNGVDYVAYSNTLTFNDFQMSQDVYLQINPQNTLLSGPDWPDANGNFTYFGVNGYVTMTLTNVVLDTNEDPDIIPPTLSTTLSNSSLTILNLYGNPNNYIGSSTYLTTNAPLFASDTINMERATFRVNKGTPTAYLYLLLTGPLGANCTYTVHYTIDCAGVYGGGVGTPNNAFNWNRFDTVAGADYAQPSFFGVTTGADFGVPINSPPDPSALNVGGAKSLFPAGVPYIGSVTIGPFPGNNPVGEIAIPIFNNGAVEFDMDMIVELFETTGDAQANGTQPIPATIGNIPFAHLTVDFSGTEPGGANDVSFNPDNSASSVPEPNNPVPGANPPPSEGGAVYAVAIQPNGQSVIGGFFTTYNTTPVYGIARLQANGFLDTNFNNVVDGGVNGFVRAIAIDPSGRIIIGGSFSSYNASPGILAPNIARLNYDGSQDTIFSTGTGFNGTVYALTIDTNGGILVGGNFTSYNTTNCNHIARLLPSGGLDPTFLPNTGNGLSNYGVDGEVRTLATDLHGNIVIGGNFSHVNGSTNYYLARLLPSGAVDPSFNPEIGPDDVVYSVAIETNNNNEIVIGGAFQTYNLVSRSGVALIANNGLLDTSFVPGTGADGIIYTVGIQTNGDILVGGQFRDFNTSRRLSVARLLPSGWVDTSFMDTAYNQFAGLINTYYNQNYDPVNIAYALALQPDGNIMLGGAFSRVGGGSARDDIHTHINIARLIGAPNPGPQTGGGGIGNCPGNITLTQNPYTVDDTAGKLFVTIDRANGSLGPARVTLGTNTFAPGAGEATAADFGLILPAMPLYNEVYNHWITSPYGNYDWRQSDGYFGYNNAIQPITDFGDSALNLTVYDDKTALQNLYASLSLLNANSMGLMKLGGIPIPLYPALGLPSANLEIVNDNFPVGDVGFSISNYVTVDTSNSVTITVLRTNGSYGNISVYWFTSDGTARSGTGQNYTGSPTPGAKTELNFSGGPNNNVATFSIPILNQSGLQSSKFFNVYLTNPFPNGVFDTNVPPILPTHSTVTIIDGNFTAGHLSFSTPTFSVLKGGVATVSVMRTGGAKGQLTVQYATSNGTATNGINYTGVTNTLTWADQNADVKTFTIQTLQDNTVEGTKAVNLSLFNATNVGSTGNINSQILVNPSNAVLNIQDSDLYGSLNFAAPNFNVLQNAGQALITVVRTNGTTGTISVNYMTVNDTNVILPYLPAVAGTNYGATNGQLNFGPGVTSQSFVVPIYYTPDETNAAHRVVSLELYGGSPGAITNQNLFPIFATLTILDPQLILNPAGSVDLTTLNGIGFNNAVNSLVLQPDGNLLAGGAFTFFNQYPFEEVARLNTYGAFDSGFLFNQAGANASVLQVISQTPGSSQTNGPILIVGEFTQVNDINRGGVARLNLDGSMDETFNPGSGADSTVYAAAETFLPATVPNQPPTLAYYIAGNFANYNSVPSGGIVRLNASTNSPGYQGTVDLNFNVGQGVTSSNASIHALAVQANGQVIAGGDFTAFNGVTHNHLIRLNVDGSVDSSFNPSTGSDPSDSVRAIAIQSDGQILIGGLFTNVNGSNLNYLARLNSVDGSVDTNFNVGVGGDNAVLALAIDSQNRILVGGEFTKFSGVTRSGITRLNPDGTVDPTINFGSGADGGFVDTIAIQSNDEIDLGGGFTSFEGIAEGNFVRVYGGATSGDGAIQFSQPIYGVMQNGSNATITLQRLGGEGTVAQPTVSIVFYTTDGTGVAGTDYTGVTNTVTFPYGETFQTVTIPLIANELVGSNKTVNLNLSNAVYAVIGQQQPSATLIITNVNSAVQFSAQAYRQSANAPGGNAIISVARVGNPNTTVGVTVYTGTNGNATPFVNYTPVTNFLVFNPGVTSLNWLIPVTNASNTFSDVTVDLEMSSPSNTFLGSPSSAALTISTANNGPGVLSFSQPSYSIVAPITGVTNEVITIIRTNGSDTNVFVTFTTSNGTAAAGIQYSNVTQVVNFPEDTVSQNVIIPIYPQPAAGPATTVLLTLSNPQNGATIGGSAQEVLTILNGNENVAFTNSPYFVNEGSLLYLQVVRNGSTNNTASVNYSSFSQPNTTEAEGYAQPYIDYSPISGTLSFPPGVTYQTIPITILQTNMVNGPLTFQVDLTSNLNSGDQIGTPGAATITILGDVTGFEFATNAYVVGEDGSNVVINVTRLNANTGTASVDFFTSDASALQGVDYVRTNGTLVFSNNVTTASVTVAILNPGVVEGSKTFSLSLTNPLVLTQSEPWTNAYLLSPSNTTVTITNVLTGVSFESPSYTVSECSVLAAIPVVLSGATNKPVSVFFSTSNGSGSAGTNYFATNTTINFVPGQTSTNVYVEVINNHIIGPDHTVILTLSDVVGAKLLNPSTAVLTVQECNGAYIVKSGTSFISGNTPNNAGVIFSNETVSILFGLRDVAGNSTTNLVATLLATNGVTNVSSPQTYGVLVTGGPTVAKPFTFTGVGTNGQNIIANLTLRDGSQVYSNVAFGFTLGGATTTFSTNETLFLYGSNLPPTNISKAYSTNPPNFGYPSLITVSGLVGNITAVAATLNNFGHTYPSDVGVVLESPLTNTFLMQGCGGTNPVQHLNLTFSQSATNSQGAPNFLPEFTNLTSTTYVPTAYGYTKPLPSTLPSQQQQAPKPPYLTNMNIFVGQPPNGSWALFAADENSLDSGYISNGWSLSISTGLPVESDSDLELALTASPTNATTGNTLTYTISVTNYGPAEATNVIITDTLPSGVTFVSDTCSCTLGTNGVLTNMVPMLAVSNGVTFTVVVTPTNTGYITNIAAAIASQPDPNSNNVQTNVILVGLPSADLGVALSAVPNPVLDGANVTYTIVVTNNGPSIATGVTAVNVLPAGFRPITVTPAPSSIVTNANGTVTITWSGGTNIPGFSTTLQVVAWVNLPEKNLPSSANLDSVAVSSQVYDPAKLNNFASVKTEVEPAMITLTGSGAHYSLSWSSMAAGASNLVLEGTTSLTPPIIWVPITNPPSVSGQFTYELNVVPGTNGYHFFRLESHLP